MPSARPSSFSGGGILRKADGTILDILFTPNNPLAGKGKAPATPRESKNPDFKSLYAIVYIRADGSEKVLDQPLFVGDAAKFGITEDGRGLTGDANLSKSSDFYIFLNSLINPNGNIGSGFDESNFDESDPTVADFSPIRGARCRFDWLKNEAKTKKLGKKPLKEGQKGPEGGYDREDLIVSNYYGQAEIDLDEDVRTMPAAGKVSQPKQVQRPGATAAPKPATAGKKTAAAAVDVPAYAKDQIVLAVNSVKPDANGVKAISKAKLSVKLLTQLQSIDADLRAGVRAFADVDANLSSVPGVVYDAGTGMVQLDA